MVSLSVAHLPQRERAGDQDQAGSGRGQVGMPSVWKNHCKEWRLRSLEGGLGCWNLQGKKTTLLLIILQCLSPSLVLLVTETPWDTSWGAQVVTES